MRVKVEYRWYDEYRSYTVEAEVHLGRTSARGDDPNDLLDIRMYTDLGTDIYIGPELWPLLAETSIIEARWAV